MAIGISISVPRITATAATYIYVYDGNDYYRKGLRDGKYVVDYSSDGGVNYENDLVSIVPSEDVLLINLDSGVEGYRQQVRGGVLYIDHVLTETGFDGVENTDWEWVEYYDGVDWEAYWATRTPSGLTTTPISNTAIDFTWTDAAATADGLKVYLSTDNENWTLKDTVTYGVEVSHVTGLLATTVYYAKIVAYRGDRESDAVTATTSTINAALVAGWNFETFAGSYEFNNLVADYAFHPLKSQSAIYYNGKTYIVYQGNDCDPYIITYTHATDVWSAPVKVGTSLLSNTDNTHGEPAMLIDDSGYIHVIYGGHNSMARYAKSTNPEDITAWSADNNFTIGTYFQLIKFSTGRIYCFFRLTQPTTCDWGYIYSDNDCATWSDYASICTYYAYLKFTKGQGDFIHVSVNGYETAGFDRLNAYYFNFDGTTWSNIAGTELTLPFDASDAASILVRNSGTNYIPNTSLAFDASNNPYIFFTESETAAEVSVYNYTLAKYVDNAWVIVDMGVATDRFQDYATAIEHTGGTNIEAYLITGGTADAVGGNIEKWVSTDNGTTWAKDSELFTGQFLWPILVQDHHANGKIVTSTFRDSVTTWYSKAYLWGDGGIVDNALCPSAADEIRDSYPLSLWAAPQFVAGQVGNCLQFTGTQQHGYAADNDTLSFNGGSPDKPFSISFWLNITNTSNTQVLVSKRSPSNHEYQVDVTANTLRFMIFRLAGTILIYATAPFTTVNDWVHVTCTYDGGAVSSGIKIFINGVEAQTVQTNTGTYTAMSNSTSPLYIGSFYNSNYWFIGMMDELRLWNKVMTEEEMALMISGDIRY